MLLAAAIPHHSTSTRVHGPLLHGVLADVSARWATPAELVAAAHDAAGRAEIEAAADAPTVPLAEATLLPPVPEPQRILCAGVNYAAHAVEGGRSGDRQPHPAVFTRFASSLVGHGQPVERPAVSAHFDYEGELAVVIGRRARSLDVADALTVVAGYTCFMDGSVRDFQRHRDQWIPGKNFDNSGAMGPWIVTADEVGDPAALHLTTAVNGEVLQDAPTADMIHSIAEIVAYCSAFTTLEAGDVIATGTPSGVGFARTPPRWLQPGDTVTVTITGVGTLTNTVVDA